MVKKNNFSKSGAIAEIKGWTPPKLHQGKDCYVDFLAFEPLSGKMKRKKIMLGHVKGKKSQREYADGIIRRLTEKLLSDGIHGWTRIMPLNTQNSAIFV